MQAATKAAGLELTQLVTPTTPQDRMKRIAAVSEGFVYLVSLTGQLSHFDHLFSFCTSIIFLGRPRTTFSCFNGRTLVGSAAAVQPLRCHMPHVFKTLM